MFAYPRFARTTCFGSSKLLLLLLSSFNTVIRPDLPIYAERETNS